MKTTPHQTVQGCLKVRSLRLIARAIASESQPPPHSRSRFGSEDREKRDLTASEELDPCNRGIPYGLRYKLVPEHARSGHRPNAEPAGNHPLDGGKSPWHPSPEPDNRKRSGADVGRRERRRCQPGRTSDGESAGPQGSCQSVRHRRPKPKRCSGRSRPPPDCCRQRSEREPRSYSRTTREKTPKTKGW